MVNSAILKKFSMAGIKSVRRRVKRDNFGEVNRSWIVKALAGHDRADASIFLFCFPLPNH